MAHKSAHNKENLLKFTWKHVQCFINMLFVPILVSYGFEKLLYQVFHLLTISLYMTDFVGKSF